jgi:hypothetical protein
MKNTTRKPNLSTLSAVHQALSALMEVELPTIQMEPEPERKSRRGRTSEKRHGKRAASRI